MGRRSLLLVAAACAVVVACGCRRAASPRARRDAGHPIERVEPRGRLVVLGFDGADPRLVERFVREGKLPHLAELASANDGASFRRLETTNPADSAVAWTTFATGTGPAAHGVFGVVRRRLSSDPVHPVSLRYGTSRFEMPDDGVPVVSGVRTGLPFWKTLADDGVPTVVLGVPFSFPADPMRRGRMLTGPGTPDLLGTRGTYTLAMTDPPMGQTAPGGGRIVSIVMEGSSTRGRFTIEGPEVPGAAGRRARAEARINTGPNGVTVTLLEKTIALRIRETSGWAPIELREGDFVVRGLVTLTLLAEGESTRVYVSPVIPDPRAPWFPISYPNDFARTVATDLDRPFSLASNDHLVTALAAEVLDDGTFRRDLDVAELDRREVLVDALDRDDFRMLVWASTAPDDVTHLFHRLVDRAHPRFDSALAARHGHAIEAEYVRMDETVGLVLARLRPDDVLIVLSDHGFESFRRALHVNQWLHANGFQAYEGGHETSGERFEDVNWSKTQAYALGNGQIYLNVAGRERAGIVPRASIGEVAARIRRRLLALRDAGHDDAPVVREVFLGADLFRGARADEAPDLVLAFEDGYGASLETWVGAAPEGLFVDVDRKWSAEHAGSDFARVPGFLVSNRPLVDAPRLVDLAATAVSFFARTAPPSYEGRSVLAGGRR